VSDLTDEQWQRLEPLLKTNTMGWPATVNRREVLNSIFYLLRTGCQWRMLPREFPHWSSVHSCYSRWKQHGTIERLHEALRRKASKEAHPTAMVFNSQSVKTTEKGGQKATTKQECKRPQAASAGGYAELADRLLGASCRCRRTGRSQAIARRCKSLACLKPPATNMGNTPFTSGGSAVAGSKAL
jgi:transposase